MVISGGKSGNDGREKQSGAGRRMLGKLGAVLGLLLAAGLPAAGAEAWQSLERPPFRILYREGNRSEANALAEKAPGVLAELERDLGLRLRQPVTVLILPPDRSSASASSGDPARVPPWAVGFVPGGSGEVVLRGDLVRSYPFEDLLSLFGHELTHVLLNSLPSRSGPLPHWFNEGVAVIESRRWSFRDTLTLGTTLLAGPPPRLETLAASFPAEEGAARAAYAESFNFIAYLEREHGPGAVRRILAGMAAGETFPEAFRRGVGRSLPEVERSWRDRVNFAYRWVPALTSTSVLWMGITLLVLLSRLAKRRRERAIREAWERQGLG
jgi:Peptidase MA superfamily